MDGGTFCQKSGYNGGFKTERGNQLIVSEKYQNKHGENQQLLFVATALEKMPATLMDDIHELIGKTNRQKSARL